MVISPSLPDFPSGEDDVSQTAPYIPRHAVPGAPNGLALGDLPGAEQVELDFPHDAGDAGLARFPGREVAGFL